MWKLLTYTARLLSTSVYFSIGMFCIFNSVSADSTSIFVSILWVFALRPHRGSARGPCWGTYNPFSLLLRKLLATPPVVRTMYSRSKLV